jgi:hypothetical protein
MMRRAFMSTLLLGAGLGLGGCESFDLENIWSSKKPLPGERRAVFPEGVPGVPQGVPPELVRGYQQPVEEPPPVQAAPEKPKPAPRRVASPPPQRQAAPPKPRPQPQQQQAQEPPAQAAPPPQQSPWPDPPSRTASQPQQSSPWPDPPRPATR